jgi:transcriptional regulator GlxA family with amidase domain
MQYYLRLKMETARYLLYATVEPVKSIAARLGFWDEFHFSRTFRRLSGVSPREYRHRSAPRDAPANDR